MTYDDREAAKWERTYGTNTNITATASDGETVRIGSRVWTAYSNPMGWGTIVAVDHWDFHSGAWFVVTMDEAPEGKPVGTPHRISLDGTRLATVDGGRVPFRRVFPPEGATFGWYPPESMAPPGGFPEA
jgi:hypothetical protein